MSAHRRAWKQRAGVALALMIGALFALPAAPALATAPQVQITGLSSATLSPGQRATLTFTVTNKNSQDQGNPKDPANIKVSTSIGELSCTGASCDLTEEIDAGATKQFSVTIVAGNVAPGQSKSGQVRITASIQGEEGSASRSMTVQGEQIQTVTEISGKVIDSGTGAGVSGATVMISDSQQRTYKTTSSSTGSFRFSGNKDNPIAPGAIQLGAGKDGKTATKTINGSAGRSVTGLSISLKLTASPSATATASEDPLPEDASEEPAEENTESEQPAVAKPASDEDSGGFGSWLLIILGGLFVAIGVGTIVLLWMRRRESGEDSAEDDRSPTGGTSPRRGAYSGGVDDQTRIVSPNGPAADPTMVGGASLADAPTMLQRPVDDEFPDPYGAPLPPAQPQSPRAEAYGGQDNWAGGGYGEPAPQGGYGYGTAPSSGSGFGSRDYSAPTAAGGYQGGPGGYGERYDEATGRYDGGTDQYTPPADPYATGAYSPQSEPPRGYGADQSYGQDQDGYGSYGNTGGGYGAGASGGGYDGDYDQRGYAPGTGGGYDQPPGYGAGPNDRGYASGPGGGYDGDYDQRGYAPGTGGGYNQPPGYGHAPEQRGDYDDRNFEQQGGYYGPPGQNGPGHQPQDAGRRRSVDWLDD